MRSYPDDKPYDALLAVSQELRWLPCFLDRSGQRPIILKRPVSLPATVAIRGATLIIAMGITTATASSTARVPKVGADVILSVRKHRPAHARRIAPRVASAQLTTPVLTVAVHLGYVSRTVPARIRTANLGVGMA